MSLSSIDFRYFKAFIVTARLLNFSKAAKELGVAQSAVSRQIKLLEDSIGQQLFVRSSHKVLLTHLGVKFLKELTDFEHRMTELFNPASKRTLKIGILHGFLEAWFTDVIVDFSKNLPHQLMIEVNSLNRLKEGLHNGAYDLIFTSEKIDNELVSSLKIFEEKMVLISKNLIDLNKVYQQPWIVYSDQDHLFHLYKKKSPQIIFVNSITAMIKLVRKGLGIAVVPEHTIDNKTNLIFHEIKSLPRQHIYLSTLNFQKTPDYLKEMIAIIKKYQN